MGEPYTPTPAELDYAVRVAAKKTREWALRHPQALPRDWDMDDVLQHARMGALDAARTYRPDGGTRFGAWGGQKGYWHAVDMARRKTVRVVSLDALPGVAERVADPGADPERAVLARVCWEWLALLPERERQVITRYLHGASFREIGQEIGCKESWAGVLYHRGIALLRAHSEGQPLSRPKASRVRKPPPPPPPAAKERVAEGPRYRLTQEAPCRYRVTGDRVDLELTTRTPAERYLVERMTLLANLFDGVPSGRLRACLEDVAAFVREWEQRERDERKEAA